ncbi:MAG: FKBP-type peptidyl-prolyl cis-trans isomerase [Coxiellaceae bacterium]|nr:MAG: FKBP-type peptidyl-prolyl cis-trans isomerase [Coxiellaceae bacterium]
MFPEIQLQDLAGVPIEKWRVDVTEADLEKVLNKLQEQHAKWQEIAAPAELKDRLVVDFEGFINGQPIEQGSAKNVTIVLGSKTMIPGFEDGLLGAKAGENVSCPLLSLKTIRISLWRAKQLTLM